MSALAPINLHAWVAEHRHLLKPPVGNKPIWDGDFLVMVVGGPNQRSDYHIKPGGELFYQVEGDIVVKIIEDGKPREVPIRQSELLPLPAGVPHSPQRSGGAAGLVGILPCEWPMSNAVLPEGVQHKIDLHTHILPRDWPNLRDRYGYGGFVDLEHHGPGCARLLIDVTHCRTIADNCW